MHFFNFSPLTMEEFFCKVVHAGKVVEVYEYGKPHFRDYELTALDLLDRALAKELGSSVDFESKIRQNHYRTLHNIRNLANANAHILTKFVTLTFTYNETDVDKANKYFKNFIKRLNFRFKRKIKYMCIVEFQQRGAVHYHLIMDLPRIVARDLEYIWKHGDPFFWQDRSKPGIVFRPYAGSVKPKRYKKKINFGAYFAKHGTKAEQDNLFALIGKKKFFRSRGLCEPVVSYGLPEDLDERIFSGMDLQRDTEYLSKYNEKIKYRVYITK